MRKLHLQPNGKTFEVHGLPPDSKKVVKIDGHLARQLADHILHQSDLEFADRCLDAINAVPEDPPEARQALWRSAIIYVMKCFGSSASRSSLPDAKILKGLPPEAKLVFDYFKNLRNKFIVHDENAWMQSMVGAAINDGTKPYKVELVVAFAAVAQTLDQGSYGNLKLLIKAAHSYSTEQFQLLTGQIKAELEQLPYSELINRDPPEYRAPLAEEVSERRSQK